MQIHDQTTEGMQHIAKLIKGKRFAMLTTRTQGGLLESRPMSLLELDTQGCFWFFVRDEPGDAVGREQYQDLNLSFSDEAAATYVSVSGQGEIVRDRARIEALWSTAARPWFPDGPDSPSLALLKITPYQAEYWDSPSSKVIRAFAMAASVMSGKPVGLGEHQVLPDVARAA